MKQVSFQRLANTMQVADHCAKMWQLPLKYFMFFLVFDLQNQGKNTRFIVSYKVPSLFGKNKTHAPIICWTNISWLVVWNMFPYIGNDDPNWLSYFSEGLKPPTSFNIEPIGICFSKKTGSKTARWCPFHIIVVKDDSHHGPPYHYESSLSWMGNKPHVCWFCWV